MFGGVASISSIVLADGGLRQLCKDLCAAVVCAKEDFARGLELRVSSRLSINTLRSSLCNWGVLNVE